MYLKYGNYTHQLDEAAVNISRQALLTDAQVPYGYKETWRVTGFLQADTAAQVTTAIRALERAYSVHGQNVSLLMNDGSASAHAMNSSDSVGGVIIMEPPSFPEGTGAEYSTFRSYAITLEAEFGTDPSGGTPSGIISWEETVTLSGGGPRHVLLELRSGPPQKQLVSEQTVFRATQTGHAVGYLNWPVVPAPIWPAHEDQPARQVSFDNPEETGYGAFAFRKNFPVSWSYQFHSASLLNGRPTRRPF